MFITGRVQGVGFRRSTLREIERYEGLRGYVRNLDDGRVEAVFSGESAAVLALVAWCGKGPSAARVIELRVVEEAPDASLEEFEVTD